MWQNYDDSPFNTCDFGTFLDQAFRDKFLCGLKSEQTQKSLLAEEGLTLAKAVEKAQAKETAARNSKGQGPTTMSGVCSRYASGTGSHRAPYNFICAGSSSFGIFSCLVNL